MNRICAGRIADPRETAETTFDQVPGKCGYISDGNNVIFAFDLPRNRNIRGPEISRPVIRRQHGGRDRLQRLALLGIRFFVNVVGGEIPFSE